MLRFGIDFDDVLCRFNSLAVEMANEEYDFCPPLTMEELTSWGPVKGRASIVAKYYDNPELYEKQVVSEEAKQFIHELCKKGEVYIVTAAKPKFMSKRAEQIKEAFPELTDDHIIIGSQKSIMDFDITLDDGPHNILRSRAKFPVLMRKPWNRELTGILAVNNYHEFLQLLEQIKSSMVGDRTAVEPPAVIALVGPSGSNKTRIAEEMAIDESYVIPKMYSSNLTSCEFGTHTYLSEDEFVEQKDEFIETTMYAGYAHGTKRKDIEELIRQGKYLVMTLDMCGAIAMKRHYPTVIVYCKNSRENMIMNILEDDVDNHEKMLRLIAMENEIKNKGLCDYIVDVEQDFVAEKIKTIILKK